MHDIGKVDIGEIKYTVNINNSVKDSMSVKKIKDSTVVSTVLKFADQLEENIDDDMFIPNEDDNFILVASIEKEEVNIIALVLEENVIVTE